MQRTYTPDPAELVERIAGKPNRARRRRRKARTITDACAYCGGPPNRDHRYPREPIRVPAASLGLTGPSITVAYCQPCAEAQRFEEGRQEYAGTAGRYPLAPIVVAARLDAERPGYRPEDKRIGRRHLSRLIWAAQVLEARAADQPDPTPPSSPFGHLPKRWDLIDFPPPPAPAKPKPTDRRLIEPGCLFCGADAAGERHAIPGEYFGLPKIRGIRAGQVRGRFCGPCRAAARSALDAGIYGDRPGVWVGWVLTRRLERERPDLLPASAGKGDKVLPRSGVRSRSWAAHVIDRREAGDPDPIPPATPFGWDA